MPASTKTTIAICSQTQVGDTSTKLPRAVVRTAPLPDRVPPGADYNRPPVAEPSSSLSARAQEILQRADTQLQALRRPAAPARPARPASGDELGQLLDTVQAGIEAARAHLAALAASLDRIAQELGHEDAGVAAAVPAEPAPLPAALQPHAQLPGQPAAPEPEPAPEPAPPPPSTPAEQAVTRRTNAAHDAARLVAIEMAVAGDTREVVGRRLRNEFGIAEPRTILDDVFGPEGGPPPGHGYGA